MLINHTRIRELAKTVLNLLALGRSLERALQDITQAYMLTPEEAEQVKILINNKKEDNKYDN
jgi:hypothetical protein